MAGAVPVRVLGDRVLIQPDTLANAPEQTAGGVFLARSLASAVVGEDPTVSVMRGTVVAVGRPRHPLHAEAVTLATKVERFVAAGETPGRQSVFLDAAHLLRDLVRRHPAVSVGEDVLFAPDSGQTITVDAETYVLLHEAELLAVVET